MDYEKTRRNCLIMFLIGVCIMYFSMQENKRWNEERRYAYESAPQICRMQDCGKVATYSDWGRRFCSEHMTGYKKCHFGSCPHYLPKSDPNIYCENCR